MSLKSECHSNGNATQIVISLTLECHPNWNLTQILMSLKLECHSNWNDIKIGTPLKLKCHSNWITLRLKCHSSWNVIGAWRKGQGQTCQQPGPGPKRRLSWWEGCRSLWWLGLAQYWPKLTGVSWLAFQLTRWWKSSRNMSHGWLTRHSQRKL